MGVIYKNSIEYGGGGDAATQSMTKAEYNALTDDQKNNGTIYFITDENDDVVVTADNTTYSNTSSGLTAETVQAAIDEVAANAGGATMELTKASYDALPAAEKSNGTMYFVTDEDTGITITAENATYSNVSSGLTASNVQSAIDELSSNKQNALTILTGQIAKGGTTLTLSNSAIKTTSIIDIYTSVYGLNPNTVTVSNGSLTIVFDALEKTTTVKVVIL